MLFLMLWGVIHQEMKCNPYNLQLVIMFSEALDQKRHETSCPHFCLQNSQENNCDGVLFSFVKIKDVVAVVFMWVLRKFSEQFFCTVPMGDFSWFSSVAPPVHLFPIREGEEFHWGRGRIFLGVLWYIQKIFIYLSWRQFPVEEKLMFKKIGIVFSQLPRPSTENKSLPFFHYPRHSFCIVAR